MTMMNEAALETLGSLAIQSQLLLVIQVKRSMPNTWERITMITIEVGNLAIVDLVAKVAAALVSLQETHMEEEDPMRCLLLQAWGRLCKCLGADFNIYLGLHVNWIIKCESC
ncbi:ran-binding protein 6 [Capsicum annuum]|uniref:ran-binding protein 6 n=1 Tax=Capsicum annuum TaxID=4072 RepID=UPI001FB0B3BF|nr:ran-binding protein 6 [Capsicum annuum]